MTESHDRVPRGRRWAVRGLLVVATLVAMVAILAVWANRQVLDADNWADTSSQLLESPPIRSQVSTFLVDQAYQRVDVQAELVAALPPRLDPLAGPAAGGLRQLAENRTNRLLQRPRVQDAWETANRVTAQQFINIAEDKSEAVTVSGSAVVLDLRVVLVNVVESLGVPSTLVNKIPANAGRITIMTSDQVSTLQNVVGAVRGLAVVLPAVAVALFALAVFLARERRRHTLLLAGFGFIVAGLVVLVARNLAGDYVVNELAPTAAVQPAAESAWSIGTSMLRDVAQAAIIMGIPVVLAAWFAGPSRLAVALRRASAPWIRTRPEVAYGVLAAVLLLIVAWGPIPATRMVLPVLLMVVLAVAGLAVLRRQVEEEFPDVTPGDVAASLRGTWDRAFARSSTAPAAATPADGDGQTTEAPVPMQPSRLEQLERLAALHDRGALNDDEYAAEKAAVPREEAARWR